MIDRLTIRQLVRGAAVAGALTLLAAGQAGAQELFEVNGLKIDSRAYDELMAKENGIAEAQQKALQIVFRRLVAPADVARLPEVTTDMLYAMVRDFDIGEEKFGGGRYLATLSVRFEPQEVAAVLRSQSIRFAMTRSLPVVVLPVIDTGRARRLWDDPNPWRDAWAGRLPHPGLFSLVMPIGDLSDVSAVNVNYALAGDPVALEQIASKYNAVGAVVAVAKIRGTGNSRVVEVSMTFTGGSYDGQTIERSYTGSGGLQAFLGQVAGEVLRDLEKDWKTANMLDFTQEERMSILVPIGGLGEWIAIRDRLTTMARIQEVTVSRMSRVLAEVDLVFVGNIDQLRSALAQQGLEFEFTPKSPLWVLRLSQ